jgi:hypothetical protein
MEVAFNPRDNGACPVCKRQPACIVQQRLAAAVSNIRDASAQGMEIVVYACPHFEETA